MIAMDPRVRAFRNRHNAACAFAAAHGPLPRRVVSQSVAAVPFAVVGAFRFSRDKRFFFSSIRVLHFVFVYFIHNNYCPLSCLRNIGESACSSSLSPHYTHLVPTYVVCTMFCFFFCFLRLDRRRQFNSRPLFQSLIIHKY